MSTYLKTKIKHVILQFCIALSPGIDMLNLASPRTILESLCPRDSLGFAKAPY